MWELDHKEGWMLKNWCFQTMVLESILESSVNFKWNQPWIFTGMSDAKAEAPIPLPPDGKNWLVGKDPDAGKDWKQEEKGITEDKTVGRHHWLDGHEFEQPEEGQGSLASCSPWSHKESDTTERLNNNRTWKQPRCPLKDEYKKQLWYISTWDITQL